MQRSVTAQCYYPGALNNTALQVPQNAWRPSKWSKIRVDTKNNNLGLFPVWYFYLDPARRFPVSSKSYNANIWCHPV